MEIMPVELSTSAGQASCQAGSRRMQLLRPGPPRLLPPAARAGSVHDFKSQPLCLSIIVGVVVCHCSRQAGALACGRLRAQQERTQWEMGTREAAGGAWLAGAYRWYPTALGCKNQRVHRHQTVDLRRGVRERSMGTRHTAAAQGASSHSTPAAVLRLTTCEPQAGRATPLSANREQAGRACSGRGEAGHVPACHVPLCSLTNTPCGMRNAARSACACGGGCRLLLVCATPVNGPSRAGWRVTHWPCCCQCSRPVAGRLQPTGWGGPQPGTRGSRAAGSGSRGGGGGEHGAGPAGGPEQWHATPRACLPGDVVTEQPLQGQESSGAALLGERRAARTWRPPRHCVTRAWYVIRSKRRPRRGRRMM